MVKVSVPISGVDDGEQVKEITATEEENLRAVNLYAYACNSATQSKKITLQTSKNPDSVISELAGNPQRQYLDIVDFDDHFADVSLDWTNPDFE